MTTTTTTTPARTSMPARQLRRRGFLKAGAATAGGAALAGAVPASARAADATAGGHDPAPGSVSVVKPGDRRYRELRTGNNQRFVSTPDYVHLVHDTTETVVAVQAAVKASKRVSVRGGGHCFEDFVCHPDVEVIVDTGPMNQVRYDERMKAFEVGPGARLLNVYETLSRDYGVTLPGGICYGVGVGGHVSGGGYGLLTRSHGLIVDHLHGVEVVVVDARGKARSVVATRDDSGELADLFWAHTGGGGGNFGVVTRYWFRTPGTGRKPATQQLPATPESVYVSTYDIPWDSLSETDFKRILRNFSAWHEKHKDPGTPESHLSSLFNLSHRAHGSLGVFTQIDASVRGAKKVVDEYNAALLAGTSARKRSLDRAVGELPAMPGLVEPRLLPWLQATRLVGTNNPTITNPTSRGCHKSAYFRQGVTRAQEDVLYRQMTLPEFSNPDTMLVMFTFGGAVNAVEPHATANAQRDSAFKVCLQTFWDDEADDDFYIGWERETFEGMFASTGGVPVPGGQTDGCYINYPDRDTRDPKHNRSDVPWSTLYYKDNYPRLQKTKDRWDPTNFFRHSMSIEPTKESR